MIEIIAWIYFLTAKIAICLYTIGEYHKARVNNDKESLTGLYNIWIGAIVLDLVLILIFFL